MIPTTGISPEPLDEKRRAWIAELGAIRNSQERFAAIVNRAKAKPPLGAEFKTDAYRVEGCLSKLWFVAECGAGKCNFQADSDSQIVRAIALLLCEFYSGRTPAEILSVDPSFLAQAGINQHLTPNRRNALTRVWERIRESAENEAAKTASSR